MVTFAVARGGPAGPTAGSSFHPAFDELTPFPQRGLTIEGRVASAVTDPGALCRLGFRKLRFYPIINKENVAGIAIAGKGVEEDVTCSAMAEPQKSHGGVRGQVHSRPNRTGGKGLTTTAVNQTNLIIVARHGCQLAAHSLQSEEEYAIHERDSNTGSEAARL